MRLLVLALAGCTLAASTPLPELHYFSPEPPRDRGRMPSGCLKLRLGSVDQASHIRYRILHRTSDVEVAMYETRRWTESPDAYVRRAFARELERRSIVESAERTAPALAITVLAFEEVETPHLGRVTLRFVLTDDRVVIASDELTVDEPILGASFDDVVRSIGRAMTAATSRTIDRALEQLPRHARCSDEAP